MPSVSAKQAKLMRAVAHSPAFARKVGIKQNVGKDFAAADRGKFAKGGAVDDSWLWGDKHKDGGRIKQVRAKVLDQYGREQTERFDRAADLTNLERYTDSALFHTFGDNYNGNGPGLFGVMPSKDFEKFAQPLPPEILAARPYLRNLPNGVKASNYEDYIKHLGGIADNGGFSEIPTLQWRNRMTYEGDPYTGITGHDGRHRMRALSDLDDPNALVHFDPGGGKGPIEGRVQRLLEKIDPRQENTITNQEGSAQQLPELFEGGGLVKPRPKTFKVLGKEYEAAPLKPVEEATTNYMKFLGKTPTIREAYPEFDERRAGRIGQAYEEMQHAPTDPRVKRAYDAMIEETLGQYRALKDAGYEFPFIKPNEADPYSHSPAQGYLDLRDNKKLRVYPTDAGFGTLNTLDVNDNPLLKRVGKIGDLDNATANDAFRIVHDMYGHFGPGNPFFRHKGEERAWVNHSDMYSPEALPAMTNETRGQNSWLNFGPYGERNRNASSADTIFADQKSGLLPDFAMEKKDGGRVPRKIQFRDDFDTMFGGELRDAGDMVRQHTERTGKEGASMGNEFFHTPLIRGQRASVNLNAGKIPFTDMDEGMERHQMPWFSVHSHPLLNVGPKMLNAGEAANIMSSPTPSFGGPLFPSGPDLLHARPRHSMVIESAGLPNNRLMVEGGNIADYADARKLLDHISTTQLPRGLTDGLMEWNKANKLWHMDDFPVDLMINDAIAKRGVPISLDSRAASGQLGGARISAEDILPDFKKYIERRGDYPYAEGGRA